jgi:cbb3-type cytochrome oxidase maturation protein
VNILVVMIPLSILLLVGAAIAFFWAVDHGQFDDLETPRLLPLLDPPDTASAPPSATATANAPTPALPATKAPSA